jgi:hypothetical protein
MHPVSTKTLEYSALVQCSKAAKRREAKTLAKTGEL